MPKQPKPTLSAPKPDLSSVRALITSVTKLAKHLKLTNGAIYRMIKVNRIPGEHIIKVANFYDVEVVDLLPLTGSDKSNANPPKMKPRGTLKTLLEVYKGTMTLDEAAAQLEQTTVSLKLIMTHWGDELPTLYTTLEQLDQKRISLDDACKRLNVTKYTLHGIRRKYGYAPGKLPKTRPEPQIKARRRAQIEAAIQVIAGKLTANQAAEVAETSYRNVFRYVERLTPLKLNELAHWPRAFREALAAEIEGNLPSFAQKWISFAEDSRLFLRKEPKYPKTPDSWRDQPLKRLLVGVLLGEGSLEEIAASRGADPTILRSLFTSDLRSIGLTYDEIEGLPMVHQVALAELLMAILDRKRKVPEGVA